MALDRTILKKSDLLSALFLSANNGMNKITFQKYGINLLKHLAGNVAGLQIDTTNYPALLTDNLSPEEILTAGVYVADASMRKNKKIQPAAMEGLYYIVSEKIARIAVGVLFTDNEVLKSPEETL